MARWFNRGSRRYDVDGTAEGFETWADMEGGKVVLFLNGANILSTLHPRTAAKLGEQLQAAALEAGGEPA